MARVRESLGRLRGVAVALAVLFAVAMAILAPLPHHHESAEEAAHCQTCLAQATASSAVMTVTPDFVPEPQCLTYLDVTPCCIVCSLEPLTIACRGPPALA